MFFKRSKYGNVKVEADGYKFDSKAEAKRYQQLKYLLAAGAIFELVIHPRYNLVVCKTKICAYVADFFYKTQNLQIVEDVKGHRTKEYIIKAKLFKVLYPELTHRELAANKV